MKDLLIHGRKFAPEKVISLAETALLWMGLIGLVTFIEFICKLAGHKVSFITGLTIAHMSNFLISLAQQKAMANGSENLVPILQAANYGVYVVLCLVFGLCWYMTRKGRSSWYVAGLALYGIDAALALWLQAWFAVVVHAVILVLLVFYLAFLRRKKEAENLLIGDAPEPEGTPKRRVSFPEINPP